MLGGESPVEQLAARLNMLVYGRFGLKEWQGRMMRGKNRSENSAFSDLSLGPISKDGQDGEMGLRKGGIFDVVNLRGLV